MGQDTTQEIADKCATITSDQVFASGLVGGNQCFTNAEGAARQYTIQDLWVNDPSGGYCAQRVEHDESAFVAPVGPAVIAGLPAPQNGTINVLNGRQYQVSITMENVGDTSWRDDFVGTGDQFFGVHYRLRAEDSVFASWLLIPGAFAGEAIMNQGEVIGPTTQYVPSCEAMPSPIGVTQKTFSFSMRPNGGQGSTTMQMIREGVHSFGQKTPGFLIQPGNNLALPVGYSVPTDVDPGSSFMVSATFANISHASWTQADQYRLATLTPGVWGVSTVNMVGPDDLDATDDVSIGAVKTFTFVVTAPSAPGTYPFQWAMAQDGWPDGLDLFGAYGPSQSVRVGLTRGAVVESINVPSPETAAAAYTATVVMTNSGTAIWDDTCSLSPFGGSFTSVVPLAPSETVSPGQSRSFSFQIAPTFGDYANGEATFDYRMECGGQFFGDSANTTVTVNAYLKELATCVSYDIQPGMLIGLPRDNTIEITLQNAGDVTWDTANFTLRTLADISGQCSGCWLFNVGPSPAVPIWSSYIPMPFDVVPGQQVTFQVEVQPPPTPGIYDLEFQVWDNTQQPGFNAFFNACPGQDTPVNVVTQFP